MNIIMNTRTIVVAVTIIINTSTRLIVAADMNIIMSMMTAAVAVTTIITSMKTIAVAVTIITNMAVAADAVANMERKMKKVLTIRLIAGAILFCGRYRNRKRTFFPIDIRYFICSRLYCSWL